MGAIHPSLGFGGGGYGHYQGGVGELRIWNTARTAAQIQQSMLGSVISDATLVGAWALGEAQGGVIHDSGPRHLDGYLSANEQPDGSGNAPTTTGPTWLQAPASPPPSSWQWTPSADLTAPTSANVTATPLKTSVYTVSASSSPANSTRAAVRVSLQAIHPACATLTPTVSANQTVAAGAKATLRASATLTSGGLSFDGSVDRLLLPSPSKSSASLSLSLFNTFTVEAWVKPTITHQIDPQSNGGADGTTGERYLLFPAYSGGTNLGEDHVGMGISVGTNGVSVYEHAGGYMPAVLVWQGDVSQWTHIAVVFDNRVPTLYVNGVFAAKGVGCNQGYVHPSYEIGNGYYGAYQGGVNELRFWSTARTPDQVHDTYQTALVGNEAGLAGCWHLNEGAGLTAYDATSGGRDGQLGQEDWLPAGTAPAL